ncbi:MAG: hypothetical protein OEZ00_05850 [Dehalococcoidia bacterium]|nr:hypothetical protein [Dehalococcoidia bacterium]
MKTRKWAYLLTGLGYPIKFAYPNTEHALAEKVEDINLPKIEVKITRVFLIIEREYESRFLFYIKNGIKDDNFAQKFADAVMCSLAVVYNLNTEEIPSAICIPENIIKKGRLKSRLIRLKDVMGSNSIGSETYFSLMQSTTVPSQVLDYVWRIVPAIVDSKPVMDATNFYNESIMQEWVANDDVFDIMWQNSDIPPSQTQSTRIETAYQNAFKAIEAIVGEPPKDKRKLRVKLRNAGINPDEEVGYNLYGMRPEKEPLLKKLMDMQQARDKKAAHGKTITPRTIGYCELKDKQALARYILLSHINAINKSLN